jgi:hypothetical protein
VPTIVTRGVASARGAGTFSAAPPPPPPPTPTPPPPPPVGQTVTFNSSGVWTAPSGVTTIQNLQVAGGLYGSSEGSFGSSEVNVASYFPDDASIGLTPGSLTYAQVGAYVDSVLATINSSSSDRSVSFEPLTIVWGPTLGYRYLYGAVETFRVIGQGFPSGGPWNNRSGNIVGGSGVPNIDWTIVVDRFFPGTASNGTQSSAFGRTAAGTTSSGQPQVIVSASSVSVTPGQQYNIEVGSVSGYVQFQFNQS